MTFLNIRGGIGGGIGGIGDLEEAGSMWNINSTINEVSWCLLTILMILTIKVQVGLNWVISEAQGMSLCVFKNFKNSVCFKPTWDSLIDLRLRNQILQWYLAGIKVHDCIDSQVYFASTCWNWRSTKVCFIETLDRYDRNSDSFEFRIWVSEFSKDHFEISTPFDI